MNKKLLRSLLFLLSLGLLFYFGFYESLTENALTKANSSSEHVPAYVFKVLETIDQTGKAPPGHVGGRHFGNYEKLLPQTDPTHQKRINYREWDVHPKKKGKNRGAERLVTGDDHSAYYTKDHYQSFIQIR